MTIWVEANRVAHQAVVRVLKADVAAANVVDGQVTLDLIPLINNVVAQISSDIPDLFGDAVGDLEDLLQTMRDVEDRDTLLPEALDDAEELGYLVRRERGCGLVHDEHAHITGQRLRDLDDLLLRRGPWADDPRLTDGLRDAVGEILTGSDGP